MKTMKKLFLFATILVANFSISIYAQIVVGPSGKVGIGLDPSADPQSTLSIKDEGITNAQVSVIDTITFSGLDGFNVYSELHVKNGPQWNYAMAGITTAVNACENRIVGVKGEAHHSISNDGCGRSYGIMGSARRATSGWNYGIFGVLLTGNEYGAGVFGTVGTGSECYVPGRYAGFFNGQTKVNGNLYATSFITTSDARLKTNITDIKSDALQKVQILRPVQFSWREIENKHTSDTASVKMMYFSEDMDYNRSHYGFLAQEVQKLFPELVHEDGEGYLSVNYVELIPLLVQAVQELSAEVETLKDAAKTKKVAFGDKNFNDEAIEAVLYQNVPNPFTKDTKIVYQLPENTLTATLYIYNMNGQQVAEYPISVFGEGSVTVSGGSLEAGMYLYSLISDGQVVDTKRMILTK